MAGLWVWQNGAWREMRRPYPRDASQWKEGRKAWAWDGSQWVRVWIDEVELVVASSNNEGTLDLRSIYDANFDAGRNPERIVAKIPDNVVLSSGSTDTPALRIPDNWLWGPEIVLELGNGAAIIGAGGAGGKGSSWSTAPYGDKTWDYEETQKELYAGKDGGPALETRYGIQVVSAGTIGGGGGGGGGGAWEQTGTGYHYGGGGGGGAGGGAALGGTGGKATDFIADPEYEGGDGSNGSRFSPGSGGSGTRYDAGNIDRGGFPGAKGGGLGQPGQDPAPWFLSAGQGLPGNGGPAIDGISNVTFIQRGTVAGPKIN